MKVKETVKYPQIRIINNGVELNHPIREQFTKKHVMLTVITHQILPKHVLDNMHHTPQ